MKRQKAIKTLQEIQDLMRNFRYNNTVATARVVALDMAISALEDGKKTGKAKKGGRR
ncbi:hypothetical protein KAH55_01810 [bacterium]|nr:hypothetical protein [bacterium]